MSTQTQPLILTVSELTQAIKLTLESTFPRVWVKGEVSNLKLQNSGHLYFSLKDQHAQIACACFRSDLAKVCLVPKDGDQVLVRAEMNVWPPKGNYQLVVKELVAVGIGDQLIKLEQLKQKLAKLGYFASERKRPLPRFPKRIGIVTSATGAVIQDILNILSRRMVGFHVVLNPVRVQGEGADKEIAQAIKQFNFYQLADILIVCRGGGSFEDLAPFNSELVAEAIFSSQIPTVSAVGHETDFSISDMVADLRAPTPSAAAEIISHEQEELIAYLEKTRRRIAENIQKTLRERRSELAKKVKAPIFASTTYLLGSRMQLVDDMRESLDGAMSRNVNKLKEDLKRYKRSLEACRPSNQIKERLQRLQLIDKMLVQTLKRSLQAKRSALTRMHEALNGSWSSSFATNARRFSACSFAQVIPDKVLSMLRDKRLKLENLKAQLDALHPKRIQAKGFSILFSQKDGSVITSLSQLTVGEKVRIKLVDGEADANITFVGKPNERQR